LKAGAVVIFLPMLNPLVTSSMVTGDTPVIKSFDMGAPVPVVPAFMTLKKCLKKPSPWVIAVYLSSPSEDIMVFVKLSYSSMRR